MIAKYKMKILNQFIPEIHHVVVQVLSIVQKLRVWVFEHDTYHPNDRILDHIHQEFQVLCYLLIMSYRRYLIYEIENKNIHIFTIPKSIG